MIDGYAFGSQPNFNMAGPSGFAGDMQPQMFGTGMFGSPQKKKQGFNPMMMGMGLLPSLLMQHPGYALPTLLGGGLGAGLHALKVF